MSQGTTFKLLKKSRIKPDQALFDKVIADSKNKNMVTLSVNYDSFTFKKFEMSECDEFDYLSFVDKSYYNLAFEEKFNSIIEQIRNVFIDEFGMNSYTPWESQMVIDENLAHEMLVAVNYILLEHYDNKLEEILGNRFIEAVGSLSPEYSKFKYSLGGGGGEEFEYDNFKSCIEQLRGILTVYMNLENKNDYVLVVELWG